MSEITLCPQCATRFKVSAEQLEAHDGMVRCGRCQNVFNAREYLQEVAPSPQLSLLIDEVPEQAAALNSGDAARLPPTETWHYPSTGPSMTSAPYQSDLTSVPDFAELEDEPTTLAQQVQFVDDPAETEAPASRARHRLTTLLGMTLFLLLTAQAAYHYRDTLAVKLPGLKPLLAELCAQLECAIELPREIELLSIESSELEADAKLVNVINLHALLHNRAAYAQAWPSLELTLTDTRDEAIARRSFHPADYLKDKNELERGIGHNREREITLRLDTTDLRPNGYRLLLFYPQ